MPNMQTKSLCLDDLSDREILEYRLEWEGFTEYKMQSDGNCQFRALADQLYKNSALHKLVRQEIVQQLKTHPKMYKEFINNMSFSEYVKNMSKNSEWGDEVTIKAAADLYVVKIVLVTSIKQTPLIEFLPKSQKEPDRVIHLSYLSGIHFNSIHQKKDPGFGSASMKKLHRKKEKEQKKIEEERKKKEEEEERVRKEKEQEEKKRDKEEKKRDKEERKMAKVKKEKKEKKNKDKHFHFSDMMSILEQEDYSFF
ncbi:PREDICTED: OTU domain-containing protein 5-A-like [Camelina sativa]|uniref:OTU domain-containing protein 5-A-like n=1 Tax=Camelina sativa TaxID=90675 RepID=A0ABM1RP07_CAMSA|nr:PREDICTED: OTU domain-containing protein 5-A-like [Camelina sativa]